MGKSNEELAAEERAAGDRHWAGAAGSVILPGGTPIELDIKFEVPKVNGTLNVAGVREYFERVFAGCASKVLHAVLAEVDKRKHTLAAMTPEPVAAPWVTMRRGTRDPEQLRRLAADAGVPLEELEKEDVWVNDRYTVLVRECPPSNARPPMWHVSIRWCDRAACNDWRDFQRIKNDILGPEAEAVQLYPAESRLVDSANQYHLWAIKPPHSFPFGYADRNVAEQDGTAGNARQRPWLAAERPADLSPPGYGPPARQVVMRDPRDPAGEGEGDGEDEIDLTGVEIPDPAVIRPPLTPEFQARLAAGERCHSDQEGDCDHRDCPQNRDGEPRRTGRWCPLDPPHEEDD